MVNPLNSLPKGYEFHHIGYATESIEKERLLFSFLGYQQDGESFSDAVQGVNGTFMTGPGPRIELLENMPGFETLTPWLSAGVKIYHFAYQVDDTLEAALEWALTQRARITVQPVPAVAFGGRRICFVIFRNGFMIEFIEKNIDTAI